MRRKLNDGYAKGARVIAVGVYRISNCRFGLKMRELSATEMMIQLRIGYAE